jgi:hypothetical protein
MKYRGVELQKRGRESRSTISYSQKTTIKMRGMSLQLRPSLMFFLACSHVRRNVTLILRTRNSTALNRDYYLRSHLGSH